MASEKADTASLKRTSLVALHEKLGAKLVGFAGWLLPIQYPDGIISEHRACRSGAARSLKNLCQAD